MVTRLLKPPAAFPYLWYARGVEDGSSAPITFDSIADRVNGRMRGSNMNSVRTTLETAIDFYKPQSKGDRDLRPLA